MQHRTTRRPRHVVKIGAVNGLPTIIAVGLNLALLGALAAASVYHNMTIFVVVAIIVGLVTLWAAFTPPENW